MHELAMAEGMLSLVLNATGEKKVQSIRLRVGRLHAVAPDSLRFSFQLLGEGTMVADAVLELEEVPITFRCGQCGTITYGPYPPFECGRCKTTDVSMASGAELAVEAVRLKDGTLLTLANTATVSDRIAERLAQEHGL